MSTLTINTGPMFSGKSTLLIAQGEKHIKAGQRVIYIKPEMDNRYSENEIVTHSGIKVNAVCVSKDNRLLDGIIFNNYDVILIDEIQFFNKNICNEIWGLLSKGIKVYVSGLDLTYLGDGFETMFELLAMADKVNKLKGICINCGDESVITGKKTFMIDLLSKSDDVVDVGADDKYIPLCRKCWFKFINSGGDFNIWEKDFKCEGKGE